jgi:hypothetical protein
MKMSRKTSSSPIRQLPAKDWNHMSLWQRVHEAISALPIHFRSDTFIEGINATDIFTLSSALGATIENQVVDTLNQIRNVWDPDRRYETASFTRQPQSFPDVILKDSSEESPILGIELKGWYLLSKEGEPSFRFSQTPDACAPADLIVVVPWALGNVISGHPKVFSPFLELARYAAEYRNYHWKHLRNADSNPRIIIPEKARPYPSKDMETNDRPVSDAGTNFGRFARTGIMDNYLENIKNYHLCGIKATYWLEFFKVFQEHATHDQVINAIEKLKDKIRKDNGSESSKSISPQHQAALRILAELESIIIQ